MTVAASCEGWWESGLPGWPLVPLTRPVPLLSPPLCGQGSVLQPTGDAVGPQPGCRQGSWAVFLAGPAALSLSELSPELLPPAWCPCPTPGPVPGVG